MGIVSGQIPFTGVTANVVIQNVTCDSTVVIGNWVRMTSGGTAVNALATTNATSNVIGVCEAKSNSTTCDIRCLGVTSSIYTSLDVTKKYFLSDASDGQMVDTAPTTSGHISLKLGQPYSATEFLVMVGTAIKRA